MIESNLVEGRQDIPPSGPNGLTYGQSVTGTSAVSICPSWIFVHSPRADACISWEQTVPALDRLREASRTRRENLRRKTTGEDTSTKVIAPNGVKATNGVNGANGVHA